MRYVMIPLPDGRTIIIAPDQRQAFAYPAYSYEVRDDRRERHRHRGKHKNRGRGRDWD